MITSIILLFVEKRETSERLMTDLWSHMVKGRANEDKRQLEHTFRKIAGHLNS